MRASKSADKPVGSIFPLSERRGVHKKHMHAHLSPDGFICSLLNWSVADKVIVSNRKAISSARKHALAVRPHRVSRRNIRIITI
jgi:hypothetical protein